MLIYFIYWLVYSVFSYIEVILTEFKENKKLHLTLKILSFLGLVFLIGFRWRTGSDWEPYLELFKWTKSRGFFEPDSYMDYGYVIFNDICYYLSENYSVLLIIHTIIFYLLFFKGYTFFTNKVIFSVFIFTAMYFGMIGSHRQLLGVAFGFVSLTYYLKKNYIISLALFIIAVSFHNTAILLILYIFFNKEYKLKYILIAFVLSFILGKSGIIENIFSFIGTTSETSEGKVEAYKDAINSGTQLSFVGIARRFIMVFLLLYYAPILRKKFKYFDLCLNSYLYTVSGFFLFASIPILAGRGMLYFNIFEPLLLIYLFSLLIRIKSSLLGYTVLCLLMILFFIQAINQYPELFIPYQGIFINKNYFRIMY